MSSEPDRDTAIRLLEEALHLRMHGERAPGGNETWREWDRKAETFLRARLDGDGEGPAPVIGYLVGGQVWHPSDVTIIRRGDK